MMKKNGETKPCLKCGKMVYKSKSLSERSKNWFCSYKCSNGFNPLREDRNPNWNGGYGTYRKRAIRYYGKECQSNSCPFPGVHWSMLDVDHIDGNRKNNKISNLMVLCVWCHALKHRCSTKWPFYKAEYDV